MIKQKFLRWILRKSIRNLVSHIHQYPDNADVSRDGKNAHYWLGKLDGIDCSLVLLGLINLHDKDIVFERKRCEASIK